MVQHTPLITPPHWLCNHTHNTSPHTPFNSLHSATMPSFLAWTGFAYTTHISTGKNEPLPCHVSINTHPTSSPPLHNQQCLDPSLPFRNKTESFCHLPNLKPLWFPPSMPQDPTNYPNPPRTDQQPTSPLSAIHNSVRSSRPIKESDTCSMSPE